MHWDYVAFKTKTSIDTICFAILLTALFVLSTVKTYEYLIFAFIALLLISGKHTISLIKRTLIATVIFSSSIAISYSLYAYIKNLNFIEYCTLICLRSFVMTFAVLLFSKKCNLYNAFSFSKDLTFLLTLSMSKILRLQKIYYEFMQVLKCRGATNNNLSYEFLGSAITMFLHKSLIDGEENTEAMRCRGFDV